MEKIALIPGSFDPVTLGHMALVEAAASLFDRVVVCILVNPDKVTLFGEDERTAMLRAAVAIYPNVTVDIDHGMTADYAAKIGAGYIVRGFRNAADAAYEMEMADFNRRRSGVRTLLIPAPPEIMQISSTKARAGIQSGESLSAWMPEAAIEWLRQNR